MAEIGQLCSHSGESCYTPLFVPGQRACLPYFEVEQPEFLNMHQDWGTSKGELSLKMVLLS